MLQTVKEKDIKMSYKLVHDVLHTDGCKGLSKLVLVALADYANDETAECYPSQSTIAKIVGCSRRAVLKALNDLERSGLLSRLDKHGLTKKYKVTIPTCEHSSHNGAKSDCVNMVHTIEDGDCVNMVHTIGANKPVNEMHTPVNHVHTNREVNREVNKEHTKASTKVIESESRKSNSAAADVKVSLKELWGDAKATLSRKGLSPAFTDKALKAALPGFTAKANSLKAKGFPGISNKRSYLAHMLAGMALEPSPAKQQVEEPKTLAAILAHLKDEYGKAYPDYTARINDLIDNLPPNLFVTMRASESLGWPSIASPLSWVKSRVEPLVVRGIAMAKSDNREESLKALARLRMRRAEKEWAAKCGDRRAAEDLQGLAEKIKQLEAETRAA